MSRLNRLDENFMCKNENTRGFLGVIELCNSMSFIITITLATIELKVGVCLSFRVSGKSIKTPGSSLILLS